MRNFWMSNMINVRLPVRMFVRPITPLSTPLVHIPILPKSGAHTRNYLHPTHCYPRCDTYINLPRYIRIRLHLPLGAIRSSRGPFRVSLASGLLTRVCGNFGVTRVLHGVPFFSWWRFGRSRRRAYFGRCRCLDPDPDPRLGISWVGP